MTGQLLVRLETSFPPPQQIIETLGELRHECGKLKLALAVRALDRIGNDIERWANRDLKELGVDLRPKISDLNLRIWDELQGRFFLVLPAELVERYRQTKPLFGNDIESKFPQMSEDISEAGKCLALNRATAAVFHLMRVMEIAVQQFGARLGIELTDEKNWQNILDQVNKAIKALDQKDHLTKRYAATAGHLYNVKLSSRNEVMHPKKTYTTEEGEKVFSSVNTFISDLASLL